eukprot:scaffold2452_cov52-Attheya_sp.AAC.2
MASIESSYIPSVHHDNDDSSSSSENPAISVQVGGISATCRGKYKSTGASGTVTASVRNIDQTHPLQLLVRVNSTTIPSLPSSSSQQKSSNNSSRIDMPTAALVETCVSNLQVPSKGGINFSGSMSADIINWFSKPIASHVTSALSTQLCPQLQSSFDPVITHIIQKLDHILMQWIYYNHNHTNSSILTNDMEHLHESASLLRLDDEWLKSKRRLEVDDNKVLDLAKDAPLFHDTLEFTNNFLARHLNEGLLVEWLDRLGGELMVDNRPLLCNEGEDCGGFFRGVNGLVRSLTHGTGSLHIPIPKSIFGYHLQNHTFIIRPYGAVKFVPHYINISGLDHWTHLELLRPERESPFTVKTNIRSMQDLNVTIRLELHVDPIDGGIIQGQPLVEIFDIDINVSNMNFTGDIILGIDKGKFQNLTVGHIMALIKAYTDPKRVTGTKSDALACVLSSLVSSTVKNLSVRMNVKVIRILPLFAEPGRTRGVLSSAPANELERDLDALLNNVLQLGLNEYDVLITESVAGLLEGPLQHLVNTAIVKGLGKVHDHEIPSICDAMVVPNDHPVNNWINFNNSWILEKVHKAVSGVPSINKFLSCMAGYLQTSPALAGVVYNWSMGGIDIDIRDVQIKNLGQIYELDILQNEIDEYHLMNRFGLGQCSGNNMSFTDPLCEPGEISVIVGVSSPELEFAGNFSLTARLGNVSFLGGTSIQYDVNSLAMLAVSDLLAKLQCSIIPASSFQFYGFKSSMGLVELDLDVSLSLPEQDTMNYSFALGDSDSRFAEAVSVALVWASSAVENILNGASNVSLRAAPNVCPSAVGPINPRNKTTGPDYHNIILFNIIFVITALIGGHIFFFIQKKRENRNDDENVDDLSRNTLYEPLLSSSTKEPMTELSRMGVTEMSLMFHPSVPNSVRILIPVILIGTMAMFLSSNVSIGASVDLLMTNYGGSSGNQSFAFPSLFSFSLANTTSEMYQAHLYFLVFLVAGFSGLFPYVKLALMIWAWSAPNKWLNQQGREQLLIRLDALGKFSLVDTYVMVLMMVAFRYHVALSDVGSLDVFVTPMYGFYSFLLATIISMICGHIILYLHRESMLRRALPSSGPAESLQNHIFHDDALSRNVSLSRGGKRIITAMVVLTFCFMGVGITQKSFRFEFGGLAGKTLGDDSSASYSLLSLGYEIPSSVENPGDPFVRWIQVTYYFFACIMPFSALAIVQFLFIVPLKINAQRRVFAFAEIANAWSAMEVFVISIMAALFGIETFAGFIIGDRCDFINEALARWFDPELNGDDVCYNVKAVVGGSSWFLIIGVVCNWMIMSMLLHLAHEAIQERIVRESLGSPDVDNDEEGTGFDHESSPTVLESLIHSRIGHFILFQNCDNEDFSEQDVIDGESVPFFQRPLSSFLDECRDTLSYA